MKMKLTASQGLLVLGIFTCLPLHTKALLPLLDQLTQCYQLGQRFSTGRAYEWLCEAPLRAQIGRALFDEQKASYLNYLYTRYVEPYLVQGAEVSGEAIQCVRKEYRTLSDNERRRFHDAINALKRDTTVAPNKYDALALVHTGLATFMAHHGPGFLGWHRVYLLMFQAALKDVDPSVCIPYWNSALDSGLQNPASSPVFTADFFGNGEGAVVTGPFAGWITPSGIPLRRSIGHDGQLITRQAIKNVMSRDTQADIILPVIDPEFNLELHHGGVHVYIGGDMSILNTAANDPLFFMHHAFIDYLWELFRIRVRNKGQNPEAFPVGEVTPFHLPTFSMGFGNLTHRDGYLDILTSTYTYAPSPSCSASQPDCGSKYLSCDVVNAQCLPVLPSTSQRNPSGCTPANPSSTSIGMLLSALLGYPPVNSINTLPGQCPVTKPRADQNNYCVDGNCDTGEWVWIPVKIAPRRLPAWVGKPYPQVSAPPTMPALASDSGTGRCQLSSQCSIEGPCMMGANTYQCSVFNEVRPCVESCSSYVICVQGVYRPRRCPAGKYFDRQCRCCIEGRCPGGSDDTILSPGGYMQGRPDPRYGRSVGSLVLTG